VFQLGNKQIQWSRDLTEKLTVPQLVKKLLASYKTQRLSTIGFEVLTAASMKMAAM
jgi:hypothetical protein